MSNGLISEEVKYQSNMDLYGANVVGLPGDRMFVIGGSLAS